MISNYCNFSLPELFKVQYDIRNRLHNKLLIIKTGNLHDLNHLYMLYVLLLGDFSQSVSLLLHLFYILDCCSVASVNSHY